MNVEKGQAIKLVQAILARQQEGWSQKLELAIIGVTETPVGWLIAWQSAGYKRNPSVENMIVGGGPYLVDGDDGGIFQIPGETFRTADWQAIYRQQFKGARTPDPILDSVRELLQSEGQMAAIQFVRKNVSGFTMSEAKSYVSAARDEAGPPEELVERTRTPDPCPPLPIRRITDPVL